MLAGAQLMPALELSGESLRSAGLGMRESLSFSLSPLVLGRALLPNFTRALFTEYVAYVGCTGLLLIAAGLFAPEQRPAARRALLASAALAASGLLLALGGFNPLYWLLVRLVPGFNLFRAPVRWLALWALGGALLAGAGIGNLAQLTRSQIKRASWCAGAAIAGLVMGTIAGASHTPAGETGPLGMPLPSELVAWLLAAALGLAIFASDSARLAHFRKPALIALLALELFLASAPLPLNNPTTPDAYNSMRPAMLESSTKLWTMTNAGDNERAISVLAKWAYSLTAPDDIAAATIRLTAFLYRQRESNADLDRAVSVGDGMVLLPGRLPADIAAILEPYRRNSR